MRIVHHLFERVDRAGGNFQLVEQRDPLGGRAARQLLAGQPIDLVDVAAARRHVDKARILHHLRLADLAQNRRHCASV